MKESRCNSDESCFYFLIRIADLCYNKSTHLALKHPHLQHAKWKPVQLFLNEHNSVYLSDYFLHLTQHGIDFRDKVSLVKT